MWYESFKQGWLTGGFDSQKAVVITIPKTSRYLSKTPTPQNKTSITPQSPLRRINLINKTNQAWLYQPNSGSTNHVRVHAAHDHEYDYYNSFTLCRGCTHPDESRSSLTVGYPLYRWVPLHTSGVCARTSLQCCSLVSLSLQHTHWGFTRGVSPDHQGPPLALCGSQESPLPYPLIPNQANRKRVYSIGTTDWYGKLGSALYYTRPYPYRLMVVLFSWVVAPWTGP
jgi:hypothetical protein